MEQKRSLPIFRVVLSLLLVVGFLTLSSIYSNYVSDIVAAQSAVGQLENDPAVFAASRALATRQNLVNWLGSFVVLGLLALIWAPYLWKWRSSKRVKGGGRMLAFLVLFLISMGVAGGLTGCGPYCGTQLVEIQPHETAFVVPLVGDTTEQAQFESIEFLQGAQVATKRIEVPTSQHKVGRGPWSYECVPTVRVIVVNRTPVSRDWTTPDDSGATIDQAFGVESAESVGFEAGATMSALVEEANAAKFLYYYAGKSLQEVMDGNVRSFMQARLYDRFSGLTVAEGQDQKGTIYAEVCEEARVFFTDQGITIISCGGSEGLVYTDRRVQDAIDAVFEAQERIQQAEAEATRQLIEASANATSTVIAGQAAAEVLEAQGEQLAQYPGLSSYELARRSQGLPEFLVIQGGGGGTEELPFQFLIDAGIVRLPEETATETPIPATTAPTEVPTPVAPTNTQP